MSYKVVLASSFKKCLRRLKKRYPNVNADVKEALQDLLKDPGVGPLIRGGSGARKLRVRNTNLQRGKRAGYRLIYYLAHEPDPTVYLLLLYAKSDQADVSNQEIDQLLDDLAQEL